ncbi:uncharacterized protein LOC124156588 [Ischnura elegans]|uniref:uncharacterized protein LOC124156588 n=1 Tax=Ischnura elegans TaxID=197161 RepID=UPI001ED8A61B|nr:uncharacterized protein LOC124156588 [Ischnura elegans]XP_046387192.1 uncharacterized protein LOC124156588 [Ischnura elegans]XP_046387197.1 uncharacterized protein LOC124156588 [Ischnura elegans]
MDLYLSPQDGGLSLQEMLDCDIKTEIDSVLLGGGGGSSEFGLGDLPPLDLLDSSLDGTGFGGLCGTGVNGMMMLSPLELSGVGGGPSSADMVSWMSSSVGGGSGGGVGGLGAGGNSSGMGLDLDAAGMMVSPSSVMPVTIVRQKQEPRPQQPTPPSPMVILSETEKRGEGSQISIALTATTVAASSTPPTTTVSLAHIKSYTVTNSGVLAKGSGASHHRIAVTNGVPLLRTAISSSSRQLQSSPKHQYQQVTTTTPSSNHTILSSSSSSPSARGGSQQKRFVSSGRVYTQHIPTSSSSSSTDSLDDGGSSNNSQEKGGRAYPKPAYSYSCLIAMALKNSTTGSLPVSEIYNFMCEHFPYFKTAPNGWKNSVRHNLSLNKCFEKIEKPSSSSSPSSSVTSSGVGSQQRKGCLWAMNPAKIPKMDEEVQKWSRKDPNAIRKAMICPDNLELLERGDMKRDVSLVGSMSCEESEDEEGGGGGMVPSSPAPLPAVSSNSTTTTTYLVAGRRVGSGSSSLVLSNDRGYFRKVKHKVERRLQPTSQRLPTQIVAQPKQEEVEDDGEEEEGVGEGVDDDGVVVGGGRQRRKGGKGGLLVVGGRKLGGSEDDDEEEEEEVEVEHEEEEEEVLGEEEEMATEVVVEDDAVMDGVVVLDEEDMKTENDMGDYMDIKMELLDGTNIVDFDLDVADGIYEELDDDKLNLGVNITASSSSPQLLSPSSTITTISDLRGSSVVAGPMRGSTSTIQGNYVYKASRRKASGPLLLTASTSRKLNGL